MLSSNKTNNKSRLLMFLTRPYIFTGILLLTALLTSTALFTKLQGDDFYHQALLQTPDMALAPDDHSLFGLFTFLDGDPIRTAKMIERGYVAWWTDLESKTKFWRPVSEVTHWIDFQLWPDSPVLMHAHSIAWFLLLLIVLSTFYKRFLAPSIAMLALLLYAIDADHGLTISWISNRNAIIATTFGLLALVFHDKWRRENVHCGRWLGPLFLIIALLSAEFAIGMGAYLLAYTLFIDDKPWANRLIAMLPYGLVTIVWRLIYNSLGYGSHASSIYFDPGSHFFEFLSMAVQRFPVLLAGQLGFFPPDIFTTLHGPAALLYLLLAMTFILLIAIFAVPIILRNPQARFLASGMLLSIIPVCAPAPSSRVLLFVGIGAMGLIALIIAEWLESARPVSRLKRYAKNTWLSIVFVTHLIIAPLLLPLVCWAPVLLLAESINNIAYDLPLNANDKDKTLIFINPPIAHGATIIPLMRERAGLVNAKTIYLLASNTEQLQVRRIDDHSLNLSSVQGIYHPAADEVNLDANIGFEANQQRTFDGMKVYINAVTKDRRPQDINVIFNRPLNHEDYIFLMWSPDKGVERISISTLPYLNN